MRTFAIHTLGCKVNTYESDAISGLMKENGFEERDFSEPADIYIINTCTVTNIADHKSRQMLHRARKANPQAVIVAAGCYVDAALRNGQELLLSDPDVDLFIPNREKALIPQKAEEFLEKREAVRAAGGSADAGTADALPEGSAECSPLFVTELAGHSRAFIKVQDGCNQFCTYCIIPYVRGRISTRPEEDVLREVEGLLRRGIREVVLTGIHISSYGKDLISAPGSSMSDDIMSSADAPLLKLIRRLNALPDLKRLRLSSLEPRLMSREFTEALAENEKLCPHFHLSLQSGSDTVLRRMNRHYTAADFLESCGNLRAVFRHPAITTDIICGFPGETEEEFEETLGLVRRAEFYEAHVFRYSRRRGTAADRMDGQIPEKVKAERSRRLIALAKEQSERFRRYYLGRQCAFLSEELVAVGGVTYETGYTPEYVRCLRKTQKLHRNDVIYGEADRIYGEKGMDECLVLR